MSNVQVLLLAAAIIVVVCLPVAGYVWAVLHEETAERQVLGRAMLRTGEGIGRAFRRIEDGIDRVVERVEKRFF
ncbi:MAG: hypothetical protein QM809_07160 [Gordonia sp. (in: high G+C Gram-positive bacteria)]|uniref:hypothetical protein n=1 Tax=Gordonia sp. (in: high G+C Gram-positive bacteria) TaxID=84139 RepID=UPI0039E48E33